MSSRRDQIISAIAAALDVSGKPSGLLVDRQRLRALVKAQLPSDVVYPIDEVVEEESLDGTVIRALTVGLEVRASGDPIDSSLDPIMVWNTAVMLADATWGGLAIGTVETRASWEGATGESDYGRALQEFEVRYVTAQADQTAA